MENREFLFKIDEFKPLNLNILNEKSLITPYLSYDGMLIKIDVNSWEKVKKIPFGNIKKYELSDGKKILSVGV
jgi:hypothetical protein